MAGTRRDRELISRRRFLAGVALTSLLSSATGCSAGKSPPKTLPSPSRFLRSNWASDPFARGAYSYVPLGASPSLRRSLARVIDGSLFFAGEATSSTRPGTVQGAIESGRRAAAEVLAASSDAREQTVILGAGAAGLAAAAELRSAGRAAMVIEARDRIGGRVHTDRSLGVAVDLGAQQINDAGEGDLVRSLARANGVVLDAVSASLELRTPDGRSRKDALQIIERVDEAIGEVGAGNLAEAELDRAVRAAAMERGVRDPELSWAVATLIELRSGAPATEIAWLGFNEGSIGVAVQPRDGVLSLLTPLVDGVEVRLRTIVTRIEWSRARNRLLTNAADVPFDRLIVTLPLGVLQAGSPTFDPPLPASHANAINGLATGLVDHLAMLFDDAFWDRREERVGYLGITPGEWTNWRNLIPSRGAPVLVASNAALVAQRFSRATDDQLLASALSALRSMYRL